MSRSGSVFPAEPGSQRSSQPPIQGEGDIRIESAHAIRDIVLCRRDKKNALTLAMYETLQATLRATADDESINVVVLRSSGGAYCVGDDIGAPSADPAPRDDEVHAFARVQADFLRALARFQKPIIAAVNGLAGGVGAMMILYCDVVIASEFAALEFSSVRLGLVPDRTSCALLHSRIGLQRASELLLFGERMKADEALRLGLVNAVVPLENLHGSTRARAQALSELPQGAAREVKRRLHEAHTLAPEGEHEGRDRSVNGGGTVL
jgi:enoyl-CoA hydratase/carnithine racemase